MSSSSEALLDCIADFLKFIFSAQSFWFLLNTSYNHGCHLASCFRLDPDEYEALLIVTGLALYTRFGFQIKADALCPAAALCAAATAADAAMQRDGGIACGSSTEAATVAAARQHDVSGSGTVRECTDAHAFKRHQRADLPVFVLG
jgi:hypothetical protein